MKKSISFNPMDSNGFLCYIDDRFSIGALIYEYGKKYDLLQLKPFTSAFHPLDEPYFNYHSSNFPDILPSFINLIEAIKPNSLEHHYFLAIFLTYLHRSQSTHLHFSRSAFDFYFSNAKYFLKDYANDEMLVVWYNQLIEEVIK